MSHEEKNIEEIFRSGLEDHEIPVTEGMWGAVSQQMAVATKGTAVVEKSLIGKVLSYTLIAGLTCGLGVLTVYLFSEDGDKQSTTTTYAKEPNQEELVIPNLILTTVITPSEDQILVEKLTQDNPSEKNHVVEEEKSETPKSKKIILPPKSTGANSPNSWVEYFLTPSDNNSSESAGQKQNSEDAEEPLIIQENTTNIPVVEELTKNDIIASIVALPVGGYAPLEVSFAHQSDRGLISWDFGDGTKSKENNPVHVFEKYGTYVVTLTIVDAQDNQYQDFREIEVMPNSALTNIPNILTPNNDGENDIFLVTGKNIDTFNLIILNTQGEEIFTSSQLEKSWDGTNRYGNAMPDGTYILIIAAKGIDGKVYEHSGPVTLKR